MPGRTLSPTSSTGSDFPHRHSHPKSPSAHAPSMHSSSRSNSIFTSSSKRSSAPNERSGSHTNLDTQAKADLNFSSARAATKINDEASKRMGHYFWDGMTNSGFDLDFSYDPEQGHGPAPSRTRDRGFPYACWDRHGQDVTTPTSTAPATATLPSQGRRAEESLMSASSKGGERRFSADSWEEQWDESETRLPGVQHVPAPIYLVPSRYKTFWEAELAAQRELEEDEHAWYYQNPNRCPWTLKKNSSCSTMGSRISEKRTESNVSGDTEERFPTRANRVLFAEYVGRYFKDLKDCLSGCCEPDRVGDKEDEKAGAKLTTAAICGGEDDWHEELFSPCRRGQQFTRHGVKFDTSYSRASSMESYTSSSSDSESASEEEELARSSISSYHEMNMRSAPAHVLPMASRSVDVRPGPIGGFGGTYKVRSRMNSRSGVVGRRRFSFLRIST